MRIRYWSTDLCSSGLAGEVQQLAAIICVAGPAIPLRVIESDPVGQRVACNRPCRIGPDFIAIAVGDRAFQLQARIEAGLLGGNDPRTDGRVFAKQRSLPPAHQLDMVEIAEVPPDAAHMGDRLGRESVRDRESKTW